MPKKPVLRCGDCLQFEHAKDRCAWGIPECKGTDRFNHPFAEECSLFTNQNGFAPLLDCDEDQLPAWYRQKELIKEEDLPTTESDRLVTSPVKKKTRKSKSKDKKGQLEFLSINKN